MTGKTLREKLATRLVRRGYTYAEIHGWTTDYMMTVLGMKKGTK
jgi:hypothetical protein